MTTDDHLATLHALIHDDDNDDSEPVLVDRDDELRGMLVDWGEFWSQDHGEAEWLAEPVVAAHRSTALFAPGGTGKSLLSLYIAACIATGRPLFGQPTHARDVLYLDYEMTPDDLAERLEQMGFGPDVDLERLHYALLPSLPGLDEPEGGKAVVRLAALCDAELVVIDTFSRAVVGDENDADTVRAWYRNTGLHLKFDGRAFLRVDHAGKDLTKGQRGTSAKNDDVDVVWQMTAKDDGAFTLTAKKRRMGWVPETVDLVMNDDNRLWFDLADGIAWPAGTAAVVKQLETLGVPMDASARATQQAFRDAGYSARNNVIRAAQKYRSMQSTTLSKPVDKPVRKCAPTIGAHSDEKVCPDDWGTLDETGAKPQVEGVPHKSGHTGAHPSDATGAHPVPPIGARVSQREPETTFDDDIDTF